MVYTALTVRADMVTGRLVMRGCVLVCEQQYIAEGLSIQRPRRSNDTKQGKLAVSHRPALLHRQRSSSAVAVRAEPAAKQN
jgi:hypothetical protein